MSNQRPDGRTMWEEMQSPLHFRSVYPLGLSMLPQLPQETTIVRMAQQ
jgi:hypothetical protein